MLIFMARLYKNMEVFQLGYSLTVEVIKISGKLPSSEKDNIASQLRRAVTSIPVNIAEGSAKKSQKEFLNYLSHAYGSAKEVEVLLMLCKDLGYISIKTFSSVHDDLDMLMAKLFGFMENIEGRFEGNKRFFTKYKSK